MVVLCEQVPQTEDKTLQHVDEVLVNFINNKMCDDIDHKRAIQALNCLRDWVECCGCKQSVMLNFMSGREYDRNAEYGSATNKLGICPKCREINIENIC